MSNVYPLRFQPLYRDYLWGGRKLETALGKSLPPTGIWAESWEIIDHSEHSSVIANGPLAGKTLGQVTRDDPRAYLGPAATSPAMPLLLKYLDCQRVLSVQVHPNDAYGLRMTPPDLGKTEAWYIIDAEPEAILYAGLKDGVTANSLKNALANGSVEKCLHAIYPQAGDCIFIPAGTVHALGAGLLVAEIQQASNTTFRLFDWNRLDADGKPRALHVQQSLQVIDFASGPRAVQVPVPISVAGLDMSAADAPNHQRLVACDKFVLDRFLTSTAPCSPVRLPTAERMHLLTVPVGKVELAWGSDVEELQTGQSLLIPAAMPDATVTLAAGTVMLDMYLP